jgi:hypothetical protein
MMNKCLRLVIVFCTCFVLGVGSSLVVYASLQPTTPVSHDSHSASMLANAIAPGGLGIGRGDGQEIGINIAALNAIRPDIAAGLYDRPCSPEEHDPTRWHTLVNVERKCHYDHHHGDDPNYVNDLFGDPGTWFGTAHQSISYPWQTFRTDDMYGGNEQAIAEQRMENDLKHEGYLWIVRRDQRCPDGYCITDFRLQTHAIFGAHDAPVRYHSYSFEARVCADASNPATCGIVRTGGWVNTGRLFLTPDDDLGCGFGQDLIHIPLASDNLYFPVDTDNIDESRCHSTVVNRLPQVPGSRPLAEWWTHNPGDRVRFQLRSYDPIGNIDPDDPSVWHYYCAENAPTCAYNQSMATVWIGYVLKVRGENYDDVFVDIDPDRDAVGNLNSYTDRWGGLRPRCTAPGLDCVPLEYRNVHLDPVFAQFGEGAFTHTICESCPKTDYDLSPSGRQWLTWFYRHAHGSAVNLSATFGLQGRTSLGSVPLTVRLMRESQVVQVQTVTTTNGGFTLTGIAPGRYTLWVKHAQYLATRQDVVVSTSGASVDLGMLRGGDVNDDNRVNLVDFSLLARAFNTLPAFSNYDPRADLNGDTPINLLDFSLLALNYNR